jgi:ATP-dependent DNA ligase
MAFTDRSPGQEAVPIGRVGTRFPQEPLRWLEPRLKQPEILLRSPLRAPVGPAASSTMPKLVAGFEMTSWTNDGVSRQAARGHAGADRQSSLPDWMDLPEV